MPLIICPHDDLRRQGAVWSLPVIALAAIGYLSLGAQSVQQAPPPPCTENAPFVETFERNGKTLIYVAATHHSSVRFPNADTDPVFRTISYVVSKEPPEAVIIEGVDPSIEMSHFLAYARDCAAASYNLPGKGCAESALAAVSAEVSHATVYTGEPSSRSSLEAFKKQGYSIQDYFAFNIIRFIPAEKRHGSLTEHEFPALVDKIVQEQNRLLGTTVPFTASDFSEWYAVHMKSPRSYLDIEMNDTGPNFQGETVTLMHRMSDVSEKLRDQSIVSSIRNVLANHKTVLVVYGATHLQFEWKALVAEFGIPVKSKPF